MTWQEVLERPELQDLPYKIELNEKGKVEMSPATNMHGLLQMMVGSILMQRLPDGVSLSECSVQTSKGVKVADVVWASREFVLEYAQVTPFPIAPEICVEIISPSNSTAEILEKIGLYIERGAKEVWTCNLEGEMRFYDAQGAVLTSELAPEFPKRIEW
jgi:Uma2 family endonuclease